MTEPHRFVLPAVLTQREAPAALRAMAVGAAPGALPGAAGAAWRVDGSALVDFDSTALAVLLALKREAAASNRALLIESAPAKLVRLAGLYGVEGLLFGDAAPNPPAREAAR